MKRLRTLSSLLVGALTILAGKTAFAEGSAKSAAKGFHLEMGPQLLIPTDGGPMGGGLDVEARYGIGISDHFVIGPGARASGYIISSQAVALLTPVVRLSFPIGPVGPYLFGGGGFGFRGRLKDVVGEDDDYRNKGLALLGGAGLMIHLGPILGVGAEASYETILKTDFKVFALKPMIEFFF